MYLIAVCLIWVACNEKEEAKVVSETQFFRIEGPDLIDPNGNKFLIQGINLGNWLNPEGYMFRFSNANSYRLINEAFCEMVGPDFTAWFWKEFKKNYITREDIAYIKSTGMNSIRIPFHYKLFTDEDYMGLTKDQNGFEIMDEVLGWCREEGLYVILDMHDAPGGQTGDNIDDSYGYPWLFESEESQQLCCDIWQRIAGHYKDDPIILGYDLLNEPIAHYFVEAYPHLNDSLVTFYKRCTQAIREVDTNHIIWIGGGQWNSNFSMFTDWDWDDKIAWTCHRYWSGTEQENIQDFVDFRDKTNLPMYMGETGENTDEWVKAWRELCEKNNIGWHFWPYKKMADRACMMIIPPPENWDLVVEYTKKDRSTFANIREAKIDPAIARKAMTDLLENMKFANCRKYTPYTEALVGSGQ